MRKRRSDEEEEGVLRRRKRSDEEEKGVLRRMIKGIVVRKSRN